MRLRRSHGLGNDYLVLEDGPPLDPALVRAICDRHVGVGSDGVLEPLDPPPGAHAAVRIWNPDGSVAERSGNGLRIYAEWLVSRRGLPARHVVATAGDLVPCEVDGLDVVVDMGPATVGAPTTLDLGVTGRVVRVGNPHFVVPTPDLEAAPWRDLGPRIEAHAAFPGRTNVQFARTVARDTIEIRIWERGAGETSASGSSSCAAAVAAWAAGEVDAGWITVRMPGGSLRVEVRDGPIVRLAGPVEPIGTIEVDPRWLAARHDAAFR